jgi:hypothetical protein
MSNETGGHGHHRDSRCSSLLTYNPLTKFDADDPSWLNVSVRTPIGSVPVVVVLVLVLVGVAGGAWVTDPAAADAAVVDVEGGALISVDVDVEDDGVVVCEVEGCVAPGTGDAVGVDVCDASIFPIGFSDHTFLLKGWTTKDDRFFLSISRILSIAGSVEGIVPEGLEGRIP